MTLFHLEYLLPKKARLFFVGDVHGRLTELQYLLESIDFNIEQDIMVFVGDLFDRGKENFELFEFLYPELSKDHYQCVIENKHKAFYSTWGNHEELILGGLSGDPMYQEVWMRNGGLWYDKLTDKQGKQFEEGMLVLSKKIPVALTLTYHENGVCHAEVPCDDWDVFTNGYKYRYDALWGSENIRHKRDFKKIKNIEKTFHGHSPYQYYSEKPVVIGNQHWLDGGAKELLCREIKPNGKVISWGIF